MSVSTLPSKPSAAPRPETPTKSSPRTAIVAVVLLIAAIALGIVVTRGIRVRTTAAASVAENTAELSVPAVSVFHPKLGEASNELVLSGAIQAYTDAPIYARASGYIKKWNVGLGDRVKEGDILAEIEAPEVDQQVNQAKAAVEQVRAAQFQAEANLVQSQANEALTKVTAERWKQLADQGIFAQQDNDLKQSQYLAQHANSVALERAVNAARANVSAGEANLAMLNQVQSYRIVRAPFDGGSYSKEYGHRRVGSGRQYEQRARVIPAGRGRQTSAVRDHTAVKFTRGGARIDRGSYTRRISQSPVSGEAGSYEWCDGSDYEYFADRVRNR